MPQEFNSRDDAVLTERKSSHPMIAGRTQPARALIALNHRRILSMVGTVHHFKTLISSPIVMTVAVRLRAGRLLLLIRFLCRWRGWFLFLGTENLPGVFSKRF